MRKALEAMVRAAVRAPSGDNTQPWRFDIQASRGRVSLVLDETRDPSPMNAGQRMARIACGAALENMLRTASRLGVSARVVDASHGALATVGIEGDYSQVAVRDEALEQRVSNRRYYTPRPLGAATLAYLSEATPDLSKVNARWISSPEQIDAFARLEAKAFGIMYATTHMRKAVLANIRFDRPAHEEVSEGLSMASLELDAIQRVVLKTMDCLPSGMLRASGVLAAMSAHVRKLVRSASGLCIVMADGDEDVVDVQVGRCMQRAWLALAEQGIAAQAMTVTQVLQAARRFGTPEINAALGYTRVDRVLAEWPKVLPDAARLRPAFVLRFGYASAPSGRCGRRVCEGIVSCAEDAVMLEAHA